MRTTLRLAAMALALACFGTAISAWTRPSPERTPIVPSVHIDKVASKWTIEYLGETSVFVPVNQGGTGERFFADTWALFVHGAGGNGKAELIRAWGNVDEVVPYLTARMNALQQETDVFLYNQPGYVPFFPFQPPPGAVSQ